MELDFSQKNQNDCKKRDQCEFSYFLAFYPAHPEPKNWHSDSSPGLRFMSFYIPRAPQEVGDTPGSLNVTAQTIGSPSTFLQEYPHARRCSTDDNRVLAGLHRSGVNGSPFPLCTDGRSLPLLATLSVARPSVQNFKNDEGSKHAILCPPPLWKHSQHPALSWTVPFGTRWRAAFQLALRYPELHLIAQHALAGGRTHYVPIPYRLCFPAITCCTIRGYLCSKWKAILPQVANGKYHNGSHASQLFACFEPSRREHTFVTPPVDT